MNTAFHENHIDYLEFPATSAKSLVATKKFYHEVFGWNFKDWGDEYVDTGDSGLKSGITCTPGARPAAPLAVLYTKDLEGTKARVLHAGGKIAKDILAFPGGRRFEYLDPAGNRLGVWSDK